MQKSLGIIQIDPEPEINRVLEASYEFRRISSINPLKAELNPICHLLALVGKR